MPGDKRNDIVHETYCDNLLLDYDAPIFGGSLFRGKDGRPTKKLVDLESPISEDAVTWSVFRVLARHFLSVPWVEGLLRTACGESIALACPEPQVSFWEHAWPPASRLLWLLEHIDEPRIANSVGAGEYPQRLPQVRANLPEYRQRILSGQTRGRRAWILEGPTEFDALIRCPGMLVAIEAKFKSDIEDHVRWDADRDQIGRVIDVGLALAQEEDRTFHFLLITDSKQHEPPKRYEQRMPRYQSDPAFLPRQLPHRSSEELEGLQSHLGWISWPQILDWLRQQSPALDTLQRQWVTALESYLQQRNLC